MICLYVHVGADAYLTIYPINRAVLNGTANVIMSCGSNLTNVFIAWSHVPVGSSSPVHITVGHSVTQQQEFYGVDQSETKQINLIIFSASSSRAGTYVCHEGVTSQETFAQLIVFGKFIYLVLVGSISCIEPS